jgi:DNA topoisomerase-3
VQVCDGTKTKNDMLGQSIDQYKEMFITSRREFNKVISVRLMSRCISARNHCNGLFQSVRRYLERNGEEDGGGGGGGGDGGGGGGGGGNNIGGEGAGGGPGVGRGGRGGSGPSSRGRGGGRGGAPRTVGTAVPPPESDDDGTCKIYGSAVYTPKSGLLSGFDGPPPPPRSRARQAGPSSSTRQTGPSAPTGHTAPPSKRQGRGLSTTDPVVAEVRCRCDIPAAERTVVKESASKGKRFWTCGSNSACNFFQWMDTPASGPVASGSSLAAPRTIPTKRSYSSVSLWPNFMWGTL